MEEYHLTKKSYFYEGKIIFGEKITIHFRKKPRKKLNIYDSYLQKQWLKKRIYEKYVKLLKILLFYIESDDDTGVAYQEALNQIEHFRLLIRNKYKNYLLEDQLQEMAKKLSKLKRKAKQKLWLSDSAILYSGKEELENRRSK